MAGSNTEKPTGKAEQKKTAVAPTPKVDKKQLEKAPVQDNKKTEEKATESKQPEKKVEVKKVKKSEVCVNGASLPISQKYAIALCKFVKNKKIDKAIKDLEDVTQKKKAVPMKGEIGHRKGKIMSGRFPKKASEQFIVLLKSLKGNANNHDVDNAIVSEAIANLAQRPYGRFGKHRKKRTHVTLKAKSKKQNKEKKNNGRKNNR